MLVTKRDGRKEVVKLEKITKRIARRIGGGHFGNEKRKSN